MRHKHDGEGQLDPRVDSAMNPTYQAHFDALLAQETNTQQHATDKAAVVKYIRRRERRKRAEENKKNYELADDVLERVSLHHFTCSLTSVSLFLFLVANGRPDAEDRRYGHEAGARARPTERDTARAHEREEDEDEQHPASARDHWPGQRSRSCVSGRLLFLSLGGTESMCSFV